MIMIKYLFCFYIKMKNKSKKPSLIRRFIKDKDVASIIPTSKSCVRDICSRIKFSRDLCIVEYGPGNGVFTDYILSKASQNSRLIAIEKNKEFFDYLKKNKDRRLEVFNDDAINARNILDSINITNADYVVSGIPLSFLEPNNINKILENTRIILNEEGRFLIYHVKRNVGDYLPEYFKDIKTKHYKLNIPPLFLFDAG